MKKANTTIKDIAKHLGISTSTVSRALSDCWDVSEQTKKLVVQTAKELNYKPNPIAQRLQNRRSKTIGIVVPEFINSFFPRVIIGVQEVINEAGFSLLITQSNESMETELNNLKLLEDNLVEGIIISVTSEGYNTERYKHLQSNGIPLVFFNRVCNDIDAPKVVVNDREMARVATQHLIDQGYKRIAHFTGPKSLSITTLRMNGYLDAFSESGFDVDPLLIVPAGIYSEHGHEAMMSLIRSNNVPEAVFAFNDPVALGAMQALKECNLSIPEDVALVGFSESRSALMVEPKLTSVEQPMVHMGRTAAKMMLDQIKLINDPHTKPLQLKNHPKVFLDAKLNTRGSSLRKNQLS